MACLDLHYLVTVHTNVQHKSENKKETHSPIALDGLQASEENDRDSTDPVDVESKTINSNNYVYNSNNCTPMKSFCNSVGQDGGKQHQKLKNKKVVSNQHCYRNSMQKLLLLALKCYFTLLFSEICCCFGNQNEKGIEWNFCIF